jgi:hypothetical protein
MKVIECTTTDNESIWSIWINPNSIIDFQEKEGKTEIFYGVVAAKLIINESPQWLAQKINEG